MHLRHMNAERNKNRLFLLLPLVLLMLSSCHKKNEQIDYNIGIAASQQYVSARQMMNLLMNTYFKSITDSVLLTGFSSHIDGAAVRYSEYPEQTIVIDYSSGGISDGYGHYRSGIITARAPSGFYDSLAVINFDFESFRYDGDSLFISGMTVRNLGRTERGNKSYNVKASSVTRMFSDTTGFTFNMDEVFEWEKDAFSIFYTPEERFLITGKINGYMSENNSYHAVIDDAEPVISEFSCVYPKSGPAFLTFDKENYMVKIYFTTADSCANTYFVDINGFEYNFSYY